MCLYKKKNYINSIITTEKSRSLVKMEIRSLLSKISRLKTKLRQSSLEEGVIVLITFLYVLSKSRKKKSGQFISRKFFFLLVERNRARSKEEVTRLPFSFIFSRFLATIGLLNASPRAPSTSATCCLPSFRSSCFKKKKKKK